MNTEMTSKEFAVMREISDNDISNQRNISKKLGISLGLTNLIIKRLVKMGYIKVKQLDRNKIRYILTPKGFTEKAEKSYNYTVRIIDTLKNIRLAIQDEVLNQYLKGYRNFVIVGDNELADLTGNAFEKIERRDIRYSFGDGNDLKSAGDAVLIFCGKKNSAAKNGIDLISCLAEKGLYL